MKSETNIQGHIFAIITVLIWGTTFASTKILLRAFTPIEILFFRFLVGFFLLKIIHPKKLEIKNIREELFFAFAGLCGVTLYYLLENIALTYTLASNVGILVSISPLFTAILSYYIYKDSLHKKFFLGLFIAMLGIILINLNGRMVLKINPLGDMLAISASIVWACYSLTIKKISLFGYNTIQVTRKIFLYGIAFMLPFLLLFDFHFALHRFQNPINLFNILFLGMGASAIGFFTWNSAVKFLGPVKSTLYLYAVPSITIITSIIVLGEPITSLTLLGACLTLIGLFISEKYK